MASWAMQLRAEWDREDERRRAGVCPACGRHDHVVLFVEVTKDIERKRVRCRCGRDFTINS